MLPEIRNYYFKRDLITNLLSQFSEEEMKVQIKGLNNCVYWLIGHLTSSRLSMLKILELPYDLDIPLDYFKKGSPGKYNTDWPALTDILDNFHMMGNNIFKLFNKNVDGIMKKEMKYLLSDEKATVGDNIEFLIFHEDYHFGQIGLILKLLNKKGIGV